MASEDNPTGFAYLKTYQALFQVIEILLLLVAWCLLASQKFFVLPGFQFALGVFVVVWLITLFFFVFYITGAHRRVQNHLHSKSSSTASDPLAPPPETTRCITGSTWFVVEYAIYSVCFLFLFVADCIVTSLAGRNTHYIASYSFGWLALLIYLLHFCLLVRNTEGVWPHQCLLRCCQIAGQAKATSGESQPIMGTEAGSSSQP